MKHSRTCGLYAPNTTEIKRGLWDRGMNRRLKGGGVRMETDLTGVLRGEKVSCFDVLKKGDEECIKTECFVV